MWVVYLLECKNNFLYTGVTNNLSARVVKHNSGKGAKFTSINKPCIEIWHEHCSDRSKAQKRESEIKKWPKEKKLELVKRIVLPCPNCK